MVYKKIHPDVTKQLVEERAETLFDLTGEVEEEEGIFYLTVENITFEMYESTGAMWYGDLNLLWDVSIPEAVLTPKECQAVADDFLTGNELLPDDSYYIDTTPTTANALEDSSGEIIEKILHYQVNYGFSKFDLPVKGPEAQISISVAMQGTIVGFNFAWQDLEEVDPYPSYELTDLYEFYEIDPKTVEEANLIYYAGPDDEYLNYLMPTYEIVFEEERQGSEYPSQGIIHLPATPFSPQVTINSPADNMEFNEGEEVVFECAVSEGTAPYTYSWESNVDGVLSTSDTFSTKTLSVGVKEDVILPNTITVTVEDSENLIASDSVSITILPGNETSTPPTTTETPTDTSTDTTVTTGLRIVAFLLLGMLGTVSLVLLRKRKKNYMLLMILLFLTVSTGFVTLISAEYKLDFTNEESKIAINFYEQVTTMPIIQDTGDDGTYEVGIEWMGDCCGLGNSKKNSEGLYNGVAAFGGFTKKFNWGEYYAWEQDFKDDSKGGYDSYWIDSVDLAYYQDHGNSHGVCFCSSVSDQFLHYTEARWGNGDLEWIALDACSPLAWTDGSGNNVFDRWGQALQGVHLILSFSTGSHNVKTRGTYFALYMTGAFFFGKRTVKNSWFRACQKTEGSSEFAAVLYGTKADDPWNPNVPDPHGDYLHGFGPVCADPLPAKWWVWITHSC
jgi:hypothetical protein